VKKICLNFYDKEKKMAELKYYKPEEVALMLPNQLLKAMVEHGLLKSVDPTAEEIAKYGRTTDEWKIALNAHIAAALATIEAETLKAVEALIPQWAKDLEAFRLDPSATLTVEAVRASINGIITVLQDNMGSNAQLIDLAEANIAEGTAQESSLVGRWTKRVIRKITNIDEPWFVEKKPVEKKA
jgi:hypothetical protein